ncbi:MAG TPA: hypothetical protein VNB24_01075 [Acidimicrobiales bacterium]|nr:hypothetical protein [Acidimicrobiales bacterium]
MEFDSTSAEGDVLFDRERDTERLREIEALLAAVEAELAELDAAPEASSSNDR